ncbi:hypothetical protein HanIR_Chr12g0563431 [Helianthus annuus]|nr:hypothetical protein HanIR_Chr12g0563431 [Helianthus annuus]
MYCTPTTGANPLSLFDPVKSSSYFGLPSYSNIPQCVSNDPGAILFLFSSKRLKR